MSETMQQSRYKGRKFVEGRLKLSTSCTECHRRKQKCDQEQPCRHCSRRYPQPPCVYRKIKDTSVQDEAIIAHQELDLAQNGNSDSSSPEDMEIESKNISTSHPRSSHEKNSKGISDDGEISFRMTTLSIQRANEFNSQSYQNMLSSMVLGLREDVIRDLRGTVDDQSHGIQGRGNVLPHPYETHRSESVVELQIHNPERDENPVQRVQTPSRFSITSVDPLHFLGITPTRQSGELLHAFLKIICKYPFSIDGKPTPNYYNDQWVPWCVKTPILALMGIFTSACYQAEIMKTPPSKSAIVLQYKVEIIGMLNKMLSKPTSAISVEAVVVVIYMMTNEWYWSNYESAQAHMSGLKQMVKLRGGIHEFGMGDFVKHMILLNDYYLACSYNEKPLFAHTIMLAPPHTPNLSTPFIPSSYTFEFLASTLNISGFTAQVLEDMRILLFSLQTHISNPSPASLHTFQSTALRMQSHLSTLLDSPSTTAATMIPDHAKIHTSVLIASLIFCRSLTSRTPLSSNCSFNDLQSLWANIWRIPLTRWKTIPGIFLFVILAAIPAAQFTPHGRFLKSMLKTTTAYIGLENWEVVDATLGRYVGVQEWLRGVDVVVGGAEGKGMGDVRQLEFVQFYGR